MAISKIPSEGTTGFGRRNLIINGAMNVTQRGTSISITNTTGYTLDRFKIGRGSNYNFDVDVSQSSDAPIDFANSLKIDVQATATPSASDNATFEYSIEGQDLTHLNYGSSSGKYVVLSFWVKSNKTGTYGCQFKLDSNSRNFTNSYTINSSNTWEKKTITINPDTAGAAFADNNLVGARIIWHLSTGPDDIISGNRDWTTDAFFRSVTGQVNLFDSTSNEFYITGVQLEVGTVATEFEHRSYGEELALCQRYYEAIPIVNDQYWTFATPITTTALRGTFEYSAKRTGPTISFENTTVFINPKATTATVSAGAVSSRIARLNFASTGLTVGQAQVVLNNSGNTNYIYIDSEL